MQFTLRIGIIALAGVLLDLTSAIAAPTETYVSASGADGGLCPITSPCRTLQFAHNGTASGGTIRVVSSGNFGPLSINRSISVIAEGVDASVAAASCGAICINSIGAVVLLRGLTIDPAFNAAFNFGVSVAAAKMVQIQNCQITKGGDGFYGVHVAISAGVTELYIWNSTISGNKGTGVLIRPIAASHVKAVLENVHLESNATGLQVDGNFTSGKINVTLKNTLVSGHGIAGIRLFKNDAANPVHVMVDHSIVANNVIGIFANGGGMVARLADSTLTGNVNVFSAVFGGQVDSYGNNRIHGNLIEGNPSETIGLR